MLTAAERETDFYSNRFAAHILRQHQMAALARDARLALRAPGRLGQRRREARRSSCPSTG